MLINTTGCGMLSNLKLGNYGSYCGLGGKGVPVDVIDQCCCYHDKCYENLSVCGGSVSMALIVFEKKQVLFISEGNLYASI